MNRKIKFRAWEGSGMLSPEEVGDHALNELALLPWELMQFTGLKDKNGKEIYEGDIVRDDIGKRIVGIGFGDFTDPDGYIHEFYGVYGEWISEFGGKSYFNKSDEDLEVIGNIYENPELLK